MSRYIFKKTGEVLDRATGEHVAYYRREHLDSTSGDWWASFDPNFPDDHTYWGETREEAVNSLLFNHEKQPKRVDSHL